VKERESEKEKEREKERRKKPAFLEGPERLPMLWVLGHP